MSLRFVLFGHPVGHSMSPAIHAAAYRALALPHRYELFDVPNAELLASAFSLLRSGDIAGANVTVPWKREALRLADTRAPSAERVGAANVLVRDASGRLCAHNTDVPALAREIEKRHPRPRHVVVIGSGGAALGAAAAAAELGAQTLSVTARRWVLGANPEGFAHGAEFRALGARLVPYPEVNPALAESEFGRACRDADVIVQATSAGMHGAEPGAGVAAIVPWQALARGVLAYDVVYNPSETEFLRRAKESGLAHAHGLGMLVGQAALAIELWLGQAPPFEPLYRAAESALAARRQP